MDDNSLRECGMTQRRKVLGNEWVDESIANRNSFNTDFQDLITRYAWGTSGLGSISMSERGESWHYDRPRTMG